MEEEEDDLFDWLSKAYEDNLPNQGSQIDLTQYEITLGPIYKEPTGEEQIESIEVRKKS